MSSFVRRSTEVPAGLSFSDKLIKKFSLGDAVIQVGTHKEEVIEKGKKVITEVGDFVVKKKAVLVDSFHMDKLIQENSKGADLKSILKRVQTTGDISILNSRNVIYGDSTLVPATTGAAFQKALDDARKLNTLSKEEADLVALCKGKSEQEIIKICNDFYSKKINKDSTVKTETEEKETN